MLDDVDITWPVNWDHPLNLGRVAWWLALPHSGFRGNTFRDLVGLSGRAPNNGTLTNGPVWAGAKGQPGGAGALLLDGANDVVLVAHAAALNVESLSISVWILTTSVAATIVAEKWSGVGGYPLSLRMTSGKLIGQIYDGTTVAGTAASAATVNDGRWHHYAFTRIKGGALVQYIDGKADGSGTDSIGTTTNTSPFGLGDRPSAPTLPFAGSLGNVSLWSRGLTAAEVAEDYRLSRLGYPDVLNRF